MKRKPQAGLSLLATVASIVLVATLVAATAMPLLALQRSTRVALRVNGFIADLLYARSQAMRRHAVVSVCASADGAHCVGETAWQRGWIVFVDADGNGERAPAGEEPLLRVQAGWHDGDSLVADHETTSISYASSGFVWRAKATVVTLALRTQPASAEHLRCVAIDPVGRPKVLRSGGPGCR